MSLRLVTGQLRGRLILVPPKARPLPASLRKALFQVIDVNGLTFIDLYAGSGAVGFEAISSGAESLIAVDKSPIAVRVIEENAKRLGLSNFKVIRGDAVRVLKRLLADPELSDQEVALFAGPPFSIAKREIEKLLNLFLELDLKALPEISAVQYPSFEEIPENLYQLGDKGFSTEIRRYGDNSIILIYKD